MGQAGVEPEENWPREIEVSIAGVKLTQAQTANVRVAITNMLLDLLDPQYRKNIGPIALECEARLREVELLLHGHIPKPRN